MDKKFCYSFLQNTITILIRVYCTASIFPAACFMLLLYLKGTVHTMQRYNAIHLTLYFSVKILEADTESTGLFLGTKQQQY